MCRWTRFHPRSILTQSGRAADVIQNASIVGCEKTETPLIHHILVAYILPGDRIPRWPQCMNVVSFRAILFLLFHRCAYGMTSGRIKAFAKKKKKEQVFLHSYHQLLKWNTNKVVPISFCMDIVGQKKKKSALSSWFYLWFPDSCKTNDFHFSPQ